MSRIGKKPVQLPAGTTVTLADNVITVKGKLGELKRTIKPVIDIVVTETEVTTTPKDSSLETNALWGTYTSHIKNMIAGVNEAYVKKLILEGVGFKVAVAGKKLTLNIGFSHPVEMVIPEGVTCEAEKNAITITGIDKEIVGEFAAKMRANKKPEPYKGKGLRYDGEIVRRKEGKKSV